MEKGKLIENEWKENNKLVKNINDCINIENNINVINLINEKMENYKEINLEIKFSPEDQINEF